MTPLRLQMIEVMCQAGLARNTQAAYLRAVRALARYFSRSPDQLTPEDVEAYMRHLVLERDLAASTCLQYAYAIRFLVSVRATQGLRLTGSGPEFAKAQA